MLTGSLVLLVTTAACSSRFGAPEPATTQGADVLDLWRLLMFTAIGVGAVVVLLLAVTVARGRRAPAGGLPPQTRENIPLEVAYTAIPLVIVVVLFAATLSVQRPVTRLSASPGLRVEATAFQWGWRFAYPTEDVTVLGDSNDPPTLVLPVGVPARLALGSPDVIHSFYVPSFLDKRDVVPGTVNEIDVTPTRLGRYGGYCAEFCGLDHARMTFAVEVVPQPEFERWLARQQQDPAPGEGESGTDPDGTSDPSGQASPPPGVPGGAARVEGP